MKKNITLSIDHTAQEAGKKEAKKRGLSLSQMIENFLSSFKKK